MQTELLRTLCQELGCACLQNEPMARHTTFKIGGAADLFLTPARPEQIGRLVSAARELDVPLHVVGRGSNLLVADEGVRGAVLCAGAELSEITLLEGGRVRCGAGASLDALCLFAAAHALTGLEFAYGIPGSVGGAVFMNAGAYGGEIKDVIESADHIGPDGAAGAFGGEALALSYRRSAYSGGGYCITGAVLRLRPGEEEAIRARMGELKARRRDKQPLDYPSAGSTFKRPAGHYASALIDGCGLKGLRVGGAMVSEKHAGFIVNCGGATCRDVRALICEVQRRVYEQTGVRLECEVKLLG